MWGAIFDAVLISLVLFVALTATAHVWGQWVAWLIMRSARSVSVAASYFAVVVSRALGQGRTRPDGHRLDRAERSK